MTVFADKIFPVPMGIAVEEQYDNRRKVQGVPCVRGQQP